MGRSPCCAKVGLNRGAWTAMEDKILRDYIKVHGEGKWRNLPKRAGLKRCGKSCRLRWLNYLRPDIKRGNITRDEEDLIIRLHKLLGNRWSLIAGRLPGRTDNEIKNYWNTNIGRKVQSDHPFSSPSNRKNSSKLSKQNPTTPTMKFKGSPSPNLESSCVVRTKASRCTRVFITSSEPPNPQQIIDSRPVVGSSKVNHDQDFDSDRAAASEPINNGMVPFVEDNQFDFLMDFEMDEMLLSEILNNDNFLRAEAENGIKGDSDTTTTTTNTSSSSPSSDQTLLFPNDILDASDFQSMVPLLDSAMDWLQDE